MIKASAKAVISWSCRAHVLIFEKKKKKIKKAKLWGETDYAIRDARLIIQRAALSVSVATSLMVDG